MILITQLIQNCMAFFSILFFLSILCREFWIWLWHSCLTFVTLQISVTININCYYCTYKKKVELLLAISADNCSLVVKKVISKLVWIVSMFKFLSFAVVYLIAKLFCAIFWFLKKLQKFSENFVVVLHPALHLKRCRMANIRHGIEVHWRITFRSSQH